MLDAAIRIVDSEGAQALTMRRLAQDLGVEAMSLYNHVASKQDVLDGMAGLLIDRMRPWNETDASDWASALRSVCEVYRATIREHPHVFSSLGGRPLASGEDHPARDRLLALLRDAGFDDATAADLFLAGASFARGFALYDISRALQPDAPRVDDEPPAWDRDRAFSRGLDVLITGFAALRTDTR